jgi:hypothetical protein
MTSHGIFAVIFIIVFAAATIYAFAQKMTDVGVSGVFESWREQPRKALLAGIEFVALMLVAWRFAVSTRWVAVAWYIAGIIVASIMLNSIGGKPRRAPANEPPQPPQPPAEIKYRRPWPPPQAEPAARAGTSLHSGDKSPGDVGLEASASPGSPDGQLPGKLNYQAVMEWRSPVPEDYGKRVLIRQHAVSYLDRAPQPLALCGYRYDPLDLPADNVAALWGLGVENLCGARRVRRPCTTQAIHSGTSTPGRWAAYKTWKRACPSPGNLRA